MSNNRKVARTDDRLVAAQCDAVLGADAWQEYCADVREDMTHDADYDADCLETLGTVDRSIGVVNRTRYGFRVTLE